MPNIPQRPLLPDVWRVFRRRVLSIFILVTQTQPQIARAMDYQLNAINLKSNRSLASRIAAGSADAGDITVAYRTLSYLFDAFLVSRIYDILYHAIDTFRWILHSKLGLLRMKLGLLRMKLGLLRKRSFQ